MALYRSMAMATRLKVEMLTEIPAGKTKQAIKKRHLRIGFVMLKSDEWERSWITVITSI